MTLNNNVANVCLRRTNHETQIRIYMLIHKDIEKIIYVSM